MTTLADKDTEQQARAYMAAWIPVLWGGGQRNEAKKPEARDSRAQQRPQQQQQQPQRRPPRRFVCPEGYICR